MFFGEIAHKKLLGLQSARIPPRQTNQESVRAGASRKAGGLRVEKKPFSRIFQGGARFAGERFVARAGKQFEGNGRRVRKFGSGEPVSNGEVLAEMICGDARAKKTAESIFFAG